MIRGPVLAFGAAVLAVFGTWDALAAVERSRVLAFVSRSVEPLGRVGREGRLPTAPERRRLGLLAASALAAGGWLVAGALAGLVAAVAGPVAVVGIVRARRRRYGRELRRGAPAVARALADAVGGGHSIRGAIAAAAHGTPGPAGRELRDAGRRLAFGDPTQDVLERLRLRAGDPAWDAIVAGILLQREAGGDLAGLLRDQAASLEASDRVGREARAATAQARFTARLVLALPIGAAILAELASPGLARGLVSHPISAWLVGLAAVLQLTAVLAIARLARSR